MNFDGMLSKIKEAGIIAVLVIGDIKDAIPLVDCLLNNGIKAMELTLRTSIAFEAIAAIKSQRPQMQGALTYQFPDNVTPAVVRR